jgi:ribosomal protein S18 acetylase RimI-like enzyme
VKWEFEMSPNLVVHRFADLPTHQKAGIGKVLMDFALDYTIRNKYKAVRLDAYSENDHTQKFYLNRGCQKVGEIFFPYRTATFNRYKKLLAKCR